MNETTTQQIPPHEPRRLEAFGPTGAAAWTQALRDPAYHGPVAP